MPEVSGTDRESLTEYAWLFKSILLWLPCKLQPSLLKFCIILDINFVLIFPRTFGFFKH